MSAHRETDDEYKTRSQRDLSEIHGPLTGLFADSVPAKLSQDELARFQTDGFTKGISVLDGKQIEQLLGELREFALPEHAGHDLWYEYHANESKEPDSVLFHALGAWRLRPGFHDLLWNRAIVEPASQLLNGPVRFWHDQLFCKPAHHGGVVAWHQDYSYWTRTHPMAHLTCWIGLDDSTQDNGCLYYVPGSHTWDLLPITGLAGDMDAIRSVLSTSQWEQFQNPVAVELKAGECSFHHPLMVHGSYENRTDRARRAAVLNLVRDGVCSASNEPLLAGVPAIPAGEPLSGQFFPLLRQLPHPRD